MAETTTVLRQHYEDVKGNGKTMHTFLGDDGRRYTTFNAQVAAQAKPLVGQLAVIQFTYKQNGQYENYYLDAAKAANGEALPLAGGQEVRPDLVTVADARQASIQRQTSVKTAFEYASAREHMSTDDAFRLAARILGWIEGNA